MSPLELAGLIGGGFVAGVGVTLVGVGLLMSWAAKHPQRLLIMLAKLQVRARRSTPHVEPGEYLRGVEGAAREKKGIL